MKETDPRVPNADAGESPTTQTLPGRPLPSAVETLAASPDALDALFRTPVAPAAPKGVPGLGHGSPVVHPADTNIERRPSALDTLAAPPVRPSALKTMAAAPKPSVIGTMAAAPKPSVVGTMAAAPKPSVIGTMAAAPDEDPLATREATPASVLDAPDASTTGTMLRGSGPATDQSADLGPTPPPLGGGRRPVEAPDGVDRNLALARLQERMLGVEPEAVKIGRFIVIRKLGQGAMGIVYLAYDPKLDRKVALKLVDTSALGSEMGDAQVRLEREAKAAAALGHPNVVTVYDVGEHEDDVFLAMEFVEGTSLTDWMKQEHDWRSIATLFAEIARGLAAAHDAELVHRDFKPDNVLMGEDGRPRVADFGLARPTEGWTARDAAKMLSDGAESSIRALAMRSNDALASTGEVCGTPAYMAPEQFAGVNVGPASDQFGFCASLYEALFGYRPFKGESVTELAVAVMENDRQPLPANHGVPKAVVEVVLRGLQPETKERHASMHTLADGLEKALRARTRNRIFAGGALLATLGIGFGAQASQAMQEQPCEAASTEIDDTWNAEQGARVEDALTSAGLDTAVVSRLNAFATSWTEQRVGACEATRVSGEQSEQLLSLRMACLDRAEARLSVTAAALADAPTGDTLARVETALGDLGSCEDGAALVEKNDLAGHGESSLETQALWMDAEEKLAFITLHSFEPPKVWEPVADELAAIGVEHHLAQAAAVGLRWQGEAALLRGELDRADEKLSEALRASARSLDRSLTPEVLGALGEASILSERYVQARERLELALAMAERIEDETKRRQKTLRLELSLAEVERRQGQPEQAAKRLRALLATDVAGTYDLERIHSTLGSACRDMHDDCAFEHHAKAMELVATLPNVEPLELAGRHANMGLMYADAGDGPKAIESLGKAADIVEEAFDANHPMRGQLLSDRGGIQGAMMDPKDGEADLLEGLAIHEKNHGKDHPALVEALIDLTKTQMRLGKFDDAATHGEWALRIVDEAFEGQHPRRADPRLPLSDAYAATGKFDDAARVLREGLEILDTPKTHPMQRAEFRFALARALAPTDADAAREAAEEAKAGIAEFEPGKPLREAIDGWTAQVLDGATAEPPAQP